MANFSALKTAIQNAIKQNGNEEITGDMLQQILLSIVSTMGDGAINTIEQNLSSETLARQGADNTLQSHIDEEALARGNADTQLQNVINAIKSDIDNGYVYAGIATPSSTPVSGKVFYIATAAGTYTNFGGQVLTQGINILRFNGSAWSSQQLIGIDDEPTAGSNNLVKSGGVQNELALGAVYDVSAKNPTAGPNNDGKWESLSALLSDANLNTLIPTAYRKGGMSIKFVRTSDNKYVQFRLMSDTFNTTVANWQGVDDEPTAGSDNLVKSGGVYGSIANAVNSEKERAEGAESTLQQGITTEKNRAELAEQNLQNNIDNIKDETLQENREMVNSIMDNYAPVEITGDVNNAADEEDLTSVSVEGTDVLKFKDKVYNPLVYSGMGRKILRKNIVDGINTLTQSMISDANTIYVIQYDYDLNGQTITVPANCVLKFDGGAISNGVLVGQNTGIEAGLVKIFNTDVTLDGSWNIGEAYPEWFGAKGDSVTDDTEYIQKTITLFDTINLTNNYKIDFLTVGEGKTIKSNTLNTIYTSGGVILGERCCVLAPNMTIKSIATEGIDILRVGSKNTVILYAIIGKQPSTTEYGSNTIDNGLVCEYIIFSKIRLHRIQYCNHGVHLKAGNQQTGDTLNKVEIDVTWIADCLYGIHQNSTGSAENAFINAYIEHCNVGWYVKDMFIGVHNIHFDDVNTWFEVAAGHTLALGILNLPSIRYATFLEKTGNVAMHETHVNLKDGYWYKPLKAASGSSMQTSKRVDGLCIYRTDIKRPIWWNDGTQQWVDADGNYYNSSKSGSTAGRPKSRTTSGSTTTINFTIGFMYYDTDLKKPIWFAGRDGDNDVWKDATGTPV